MRKFFALPVSPAMQPVRHFLSVLLGNLRVPIVSGPNRGVQVSLPVCGRHWAGRWEEERVAMVERLVQPGDVVWDIGAHHGLVSIMAARLAGPDGEVQAFEPAPSNHSLLRRHLAWNGASNVTAHNLAIAASNGRRSFGGGSSSQTFALDAGNDLVECATIASILASGVRPPTVIKLDAEGAEGEILAASMESIPKNCRLLVSIHSDRNYEAVVAALDSHGFRVLETSELREWANRKAPRWGRDPDLLAFGPEVKDCFAGFRSLRAFANPR
jgi:FkbM family methyltransferase